jgi:hypothetical protein
LVKPKGIKGQLLATFVSQNYDVEKTVLDALVGLPVYVVPPILSGVRKTQILAASWHKRGMVIELDGVINATIAHDLADRFLLANITDLSPQLLALVDVCQLIDGLKPGQGYLGKTVSDVKLGLIGKIKEERAGKAQTLWVVAGSDCDYLLPAVNDLIVKIDGDDVLMDLPLGILDIQRGASL